MNRAAEFRTFCLLVAIKLPENSQCVYVVVRRGRDALKEESVGLSPTEIF